MGGSWKEVVAADALLLGTCAAAIYLLNGLEDLVKRWAEWWYLRRLLRTARRKDGEGK